MIITQKLIVIVAALAVAAVGIVWYVTHPRVPVMTHAVIVADVSDSVRADMSAVVGLAADFLNKANLSKGSTLTVLTTGDNKSAGEPRRVAKYDVPFSRRFAEGKGALMKRKQEILADLDKQLKLVRRTDQSPIFLAAVRGIEQLRADGCRAGSRCFLYIRTDAEELSEPAIKRALETEGKPTGFSAGMSNQGIHVMFCGMAETNEAGNRDTVRVRLHTAAHGDRLRQVWLSLFTTPELVTFEPYCSRSGISTAARAEN